MRAFVVVAAALVGFTAPALPAQDSAAFVIRIGRDTLGLERAIRAGNQIKGEYVVRAPRAVHALYTADLNADGSMRRFELITHNIAGGPGPAETRTVVEFAGDSATLTLPRGDSTVTQRAAAGPGAWLWVGYPPAIYEVLGRQARAAGGGPYTVTALSPGPLRGTVTVTRGGGDTLLATIALSIGEVGPIRMTLDPAGRLTWLSGVGTAFQSVAERVPSVDIAAAGPAFAARPLGTLSPRDTVRAAVSGADLRVEYGRPLKRGREIFGQVVPWNQVWRAGANAATHFHTPVELTIGGADVPAGTYTLWALPSPAGWKLIINRQTGQWGTDYHADRDLVRVDMRVETLPQPVEQFTIAIEPDGAGAMLRMAWDRTRVSVPIARRQ
jgi:hypothetical protein